MSVFGTIAVWNRVVSLPFDISMYIWIRIEHVSEFKYLGCVLDESSTDEAEYRRKVASGRKVVSAIRSVVNARISSLSLLVVPVLMFGSETMI